MKYGEFSIQILSESFELFEATIDRLLSFLIVHARGTALGFFARATDFFRTGFTGSRRASQCRKGAFFQAPDVFVVGPGISARSAVMNFENFRSDPSNEASIMADDDDAAEKA